LDLLGRREPAIYGDSSLEKINKDLRLKADLLGLSVEIFQSNHEGDIVDEIGKATKKFDALIINPAAYTHTSIAIADAINACGVPAIEVHLSNIYAREDFRRQSMIAPVAAGQISGFGAGSYQLALEAVRFVFAKKSRRTPS